jgi:2-keto-4-pentenoate hydratase/2-oxohepta-3-ene-1,7-dioic acid hydratase in catechol pathway
MRLARVLSKSWTRPRIALERDDELYDVATLEATLGAQVDVPGEASDFHTRVVAMGCAGLFDLDARVVASERPATAHIPRGQETVILAPSDTDRATYIHVDASALRAGASAPVRIGHARTLFGQDAFVDVPRSESRPDFEVGLGIVVGEDLRDAGRAEARAAILGYAVLVDWCARDFEDAAPRHASAKGLFAQLGPCLIAAPALGRVERLRVTVHLRARAIDAGCVADLGIQVDDAVALASSIIELRAGDVIGVGPFPRATAASLEHRLALHEPVAAGIERIGTLRGTAVPRR